MDNTGSSSNLIPSSANNFWLDQSNGAVDSVLEQSVNLLSSLNFGGNDNRPAGGDSALSDNNNNNHSKFKCSVKFLF